MNPMAIVLDVVLAGIIVREVAGFQSRYRRLKAAVAAGEPGARLAVYRRLLVFEWAIAALALLALRVAGQSLDPGVLALEHTRFVRPFMQAGPARAGVIVGVLVGLTLGTLAFVAVRLAANRRARPAAPAAPSRWRRLIPDFTALLPATPRERWLWLAAAVSAGICEEIVFRGWLLAALHGTGALGGTTLLLAAAALFGLAHAYQGPSGMLLTGYAGLLFGVLYVVSGSLLLPILLHVLIDARFAVMPAPRAAGAADVAGAAAGGR